MSEKIETNPTSPKFKVNDRVKITKYKSTFSKGYSESWSREIFIVDSASRTNPQTYEIKEQRQNNRNFL